MKHLAIPPPGSTRSLLLAGGIVCAVAVVLRLLGLGQFGIVELIVLVVISTRPAKDRPTNSSREGDDMGNNQSP
jgi:hypothetical protein